MGLMAATLTACTPLFGIAECERPAQGDELSSLITVNGAVGAMPTIEAFTPIRSTALRTSDIVRGGGTALTSTDQLMVVDISLFRGENGERIIGTQYDADFARVSNMGHWSSQAPGLGSALQCATEGSRIIAVLGPEQIGAIAQQAFGISESESVIAVYDLHQVYLARAEGTRVFNSERGLPSVVRAPDGRPGIVVPGSDAPTTLVTQLLIQGDGETLSEDTAFRAHYTGVTWAGRAVFDSSWGEATPARFTLDGLVPGVAEALKGQRVGSQVLVVVPPELGYGDTPRPRIPAGSTLVFVFDILGVEAPPAR